MEFEERINRDQGNYIVASDHHFEDILLKEPITLNTGSINVGDMTDMHGWFTKPVRFCGILQDQQAGSIKKAIFYIGESSGDLFFNTACQYYDVTFIIGPDHIGKSYKTGTFRDCFLKEKSNKYYWK